MIGKFLTVAVTLAVAASAPQAEPAKTESYQHFDRDVHPDDVSCDPNGHIFLLLPHYSDCNKFFMCAHGEEVLFSCSAPSLIFDFHMQECNWPLAGTCTLRTPPEIEGSGDEVNDNMIGLFVDALEHQAVDTVASVRPISGDMLTNYNGILNCNRADQAARQIPYKGDCQRYWKCVSGAPQVAYCTDGLFFNEATQQCDFEANSKCNAVLPEDELQSEFIVYKN